VRKSGPRGTIPPSLPLRDAHDYEDNYRNHPIAHSNKADSNICFKRENEASDYEVLEHRIVHVTTIFRQVARMVDENSVSVQNPLGPCPPPTNSTACVK
jgi:hypothetical protein